MLFFFISIQILKHINNFAELLHMVFELQFTFTSAETHDPVYNPVQYGYDFHFINLLLINLLQGAICTHVGLYDPIKRKHDVRKLRFFIGLGYLFIYIFIYIYRVVLTYSHVSLHYSISNFH